MISFNDVSLSNNRGHRHLEYSIFILTHCGLVTSYDVQIKVNNASGNGVLLVRFSGIHTKAIAPGLSKLPFHEVRLQMILSKLFPYLPGANDKSKLITAGFQLLGLAFDLVLPSIGT